jgi:hypothetical protein
MPPTAGYAPGHCYTGRDPPTHAKTVSVSTSVDRVPTLPTSPLGRSTPQLVAKTIYTAGCTVPAHASQHLCSKELHQVGFGAGRNWRASRTCRLRSSAIRSMRIFLRPTARHAFPPTASVRPRDRVNPDGNAGRAGGAARGPLVHSVVAAHSVTTVATRQQRTVRRLTAHVRAQRVDPLPHGRRRDHGA